MGTKRKNSSQITENQLIMKSFVGVAGFEPATSASQTRRDNRATLHPEVSGANIGLFQKSSNITTHLYNNIL